MKTAKLLCAGMLALTLLSGCGGQSVRCTFGNAAIGGGGYIPGIVCSKAEAGLAFCRTDIGGAYRRRGGSDWVPITDHLGGVNSDNWNLIGIESAAADPNDAERVYLACGTYAGAKGAILRSADCGETWEQTGLPFAVGGNLSGRGVGERLAVDPKDSAHILFGSRTEGLWESRDFGQTWAKNEAFPVTGDYVQERNSLGIMWIEFDPSGSDMYVCAAMTDGRCIYRSQDGGKSFSLLEGAEKPGFYPLRAEISANGFLYLCYSDSCGPNAEVKGGAVCRYDLSAGELQDITPQGNDGRYGGFSGIAVDPNDPDTIVCGTLGFWSERGENFYRSTDGGETWTPFFSSTETNCVMDVSEAQWLNWGREEAQTGWWIADIEFDPFDSDVIYYGTGASLFSTENLTALGSGTPVTVKFDAAGIEETAVFKVISTPVTDGSPALYSIMGDLTGFAHLDPNVRPDNAHFMHNGTASDVAAAWQNGKIAVYTNDDKKAPLTYTDDGGQTWHPFETRPANFSGGKAAVSADGGITVWAPGILSPKVYFTADFGKQWFVAGGLGAGAEVFADKLNPNRFYAAANGTVYRSDNGAVKFEETGLKVGDSCELVPSAEQEDFLWIRSGTEVGYSEDAGQTVTYLKNVSANAIGVGKAKDRSGAAMPLYLLGEVNGQGGGIYMTENHGKTWTKLNSETECFGLITPSIAGDASQWGRFYFATNGRGIIMGQVQE